LPFVASPLRVLITGATGFVGGWLAQDLVGQCSDAVLWGTAHGPVPVTPLPPDLRLLPCDLTDERAVAGVVAETAPDRVFHLAGFAATGAGAPDLIRRANVDATVCLLRALAGQGKPCRVLLASSGYVYGTTPAERPAREEDPLSPAGAYAESKVQMEEAARALAESVPGLRITAARAFNHTGPRQGPDFVVPAFARQIARIEAGLEPPVVRVGNLDAQRDFLHVRDVVRAYRLLLMDADDGENASSPPWRLMNVASGDAVRIRTLLDGLLLRARVPLAIESDPERARPTDLARCVGDPARLKSLTGWEPEIGLARTLEETLEWWREQAAGAAPGAPGTTAR
jgi:GDP-4-dehydro-6-deoxy-D-mannose reductase